MAGATSAVLSSIGGSVNGNDSFTKILLHMDGSNGGTVFTESATGGAPKTWTAAGSAVTSTAAQKFGTASLDCGAVAGYIETADSIDFTLGANDWTYDCWFNRQGGDGTRRILGGQATSGAAQISAYIELLAANTLRMTVVTDGGSFTVTGTTTFTSTGWNHVAGVRTGNTLKLFVNGTQEGGDVAVTGTVVDSATKYSIGRLGEFTTLGWNGYIDEFRLSVGIARWTSNFTPSSSAYS